jgi:hypothetical protein
MPSTGARSTEPVNSPNGRSGSLDRSNRPRGVSGGRFSVRFSLGKVQHHHQLPPSIATKIDQELVIAGQPDIIADREGSLLAPQLEQAPTE